MKVFKALLMGLLFTGVSAGANPITSTTSENEAELPWLVEQQSREMSVGDEVIIYVPSLFDYKILQEAMSGNGFGPGNGGNEFIFEVDSIAKKIIKVLEENPALFPEVNVDDFKKITRTTAIFFIKDLPQEDIRYLDAIHFSQQQVIAIKIDHWQTLNAEEKRKLIFHEYLGVMGLEKENAHISNRLEDSEGLINSFATDNEFLSNVANIQWYYSRSSTDADAYFIKLNADQTGAIRTRYGSSPFTWKVTNESVVITPLKAIGYKGIRVVKLPHKDYSMPVETSYNFKEFKLRFDDQVGSYFTVESNIYVCLKLNEEASSEEERNKETCHYEAKESSQLIGLRKVSKIDLKISSDDRLILPVTMDINELLQSRLYEFSNATDLKDRTDFLKEEEGNDLRNFGVRDNTIYYQDRQNHRYTLSVIKKQNGVERALLEINHSNGDKTIHLAPFVKVDPRPFLFLDRDDVVGDLYTIYSGVSMSDDSHPYFFNDNQIGGFEFYFYENGVEGKYTNKWYWELLDDNRIKATKYMYGTADSYSGGLIEEDEDFFKCVNSEIECFSYQERTYELLKRTGNRMTFLRVLRTFKGQVGNLKNVATDIWVLEKF